MGAEGQLYGRPDAAKAPFTVWMFFSMLMGISPFRTERIALDPIRASWPCRLARRVHRSNLIRSLKIR